jgi:hypothetical protein
MSPHLASSPWIRPLPLLALLAALLTGCPPSSDGTEEANKTGAEQVADRAAEAKAREMANAVTARERGITVADPDREEEKPLLFDTVEISPAEPRIDVKQLRASSTLMPGATPFTEVEYQWFVAGRELIGYTRSVLRVEEGKWKPGDTVEVVAHASDEKGRQTTSKPVAVVFGNTAPVITTDLRKVKYLNGTRLQAEDEDGDQVTWSVEGDPPGVTVTAAGVIQVRNVQVAEDWSGEAVFVATDPHGARSEIHIPLSVNAAKEAKVEDAGTKESQTSSRTMTDEELIKAGEAETKEFEGMSEQQINEELDRRRALQDK